jgi:hypothetical protein
MSEFEGRPPVGLSAMDGAVNAVDIVATIAEECSNSLTLLMLSTQTRQAIDAHACTPARPN